MTSGHLLRVFHFFIHFGACVPLFPDSSIVISIEVFSVALSTQFFRVSLLCFSLSRALHDVLFSLADG